MLIPPKCSRKHAEAQFTVEEQLSKVVFLNPLLHEVRQITVDGCVFKAADGKRCDHLVSVDETNTSIFVELKGSDIAGAFEQLAQTQERLAEYANRRIFWIISYSGSPRIDTDIQDLQLRARRKKRARLEVVESPHHHTL